MNLVSSQILVFKGDFSSLKNKNPNQKLGGVQKEGESKPYNFKVKNERWNLFRSIQK